MITPYLTFNGNCKDALTFYRVFHAAATDKFGTNWNVVAEEAPKQAEV